MLWFSGGLWAYSGLEKMERTIQMAKESGYPVVHLLEGGGHRIQEGLDAREFSRQTKMSAFADMAQMSGWVPMVAAIMGEGFAGPANFASFSDFLPMVKNSTMGIAGPKLVKAALGADFSKEDLGGAEFHTRKTGMADLLVENDEQCIEEIKRFLSYLPSNASQSPPRNNSFISDLNVNEAIMNILPESLSRGYNMRGIIELIFDEGSVYDLKPDYAKNIITAFARMNGRVVGVIANQPLHVGGIMDAAACTKASRFVSMCDSYNIPLITFIDVAGFMPGRESEMAGLIRKSGKLMYEFAQITVPKISIVIRKAYGFAYVVLANKSNYHIAWPTAEICAMGIEGAVDVAYQKTYINEENPVQKREELIQHFRKQTGAIRAAEGFGIDDVINPLDTRKLLVKALERLPERLPKHFPNRKHGIHPI